MESSRDLESGPSRPLSRTLTTGAFSDVMDPEVVPSSLAAIAGILRVANEIEKEAPRVAYLCRFYAFDKAHRIDPSSSGRGVRQFKTALLHKLEQDEDITKNQRTERNDAREMQQFYKRYYDNYVKALGDKAGDTIDGARLTKSYQTAYVLFEVLMAVNQQRDPAELSPEIMQAAKDVQAKVGVYVAYNILPLDPAGKSQAIMMLPEIKLAVMALRNTRALPFKEEDKSEFDLLDWLQSKFGFQKANVANQREHLILLLANVHQRMVSAAAADPYKMLNEAALTHVMKKLFKSYKRWCKFLGRPDNFSTPSTQQDKQQHNILYIGLYLLIWGEAANLRFMPESLCYIFHHMAFELRGMVTGVVSPVTGENIEPAYGVGSEDENSFLVKVVTPLYNVIAEEVSCNKNGKARHSAWRNYDDLNEYFWNVDCFRLGWPMKIKSADFFKGPTPRSSFRQVGKEKSERKEIGTSHTKKKRSVIEKEPSWVGKTNFVEVRSFWHIFRSFDRMWSFFILTLQALIIIAWSGTGSITDVFRGSVLKNVLSVFITAAILRLLQAIVDIGLSCKAWRSMRYMEVLRYILKVIVAFAWVIILPVCYAHTWGKSIRWLSILNTWFGESKNSYLYVIAILIYLAPDAFSALMFWFPVWRRKLEKFDHGMVQLLLWWAQPPLLIGRGMHDHWFILFKYTFFWVLVITSKLVFSFYVEIKPLIKPTRDFMTAPTEGQYQWHELFPKANGNMGAVVTLWSPIIMVYFMDMQIWYAIWSTIAGGVIGAYSRLGEIRTFAILRTRFDALPKAINDNLIPSSSSKEKARHKVSMFSKGPKPLDQWSSVRTEDASGHEKLVEAEKDQMAKELELAKFSQIWNTVIETLYEEDYINIKEKELLLMPFSSPNKYIQWPPFLLANKVALALDTVKDLTNENSDAEFLKRVEKDDHLLYALRECYDLFKSILFKLTKASQEKGVLDMIFKDIDQKIDEGTFIKAHKMKELPTLYKKIVELVKILEEQDDTKREQVTYLLQDIYEVYQKDIRHEEMSLDSRHGSASKPDEGVLGKIEDLSPQLFQKTSILYPPSSEDKTLMQQIKRLHLLLTIEESAMDIPSNLQARRRITFFTNSVFMDMPSAPEVRNMLSFSVLTPYFDEEILYTQKGLEEENEDGVSILFYLQKIYPDEWKNFQQRTGCPSEKFWDKGFSDSVRKWASYRAQTLTRTVRGMMYYQKALELQAFFDKAEQEEILAGYQKLATGVEDGRQHLLWSNIQAIADVKFTYVATCQLYGVHKRSKDPKAGYILQLMKEHPALRVAYIDEVEAGKNKGEIGKSKEYFSVLVKGIPESDSDQEIYRIKLPGKPILGEGKPENQNHAIIFTRGEALQAIDMNQDNYLEEALKMRNLLEEFNQKNGLDYPSILGMREHIFTGSVSSLAGFMSNQESSFVTIGQRVLANPLRVRFHYGHPDVFDRLFHIANGGISKASKGVNLSEDIFAGFNTTLRGGIVTHHEYIQVGKGRDVGLNQISMFEAKIANGNGEQTISRDVYRLGHRLDFFRMLSVYVTTVGFYISTMIVVLTVYVFLYGRVYLALSGLEASLTHFAGLSNNTPLEAALASQSFVQIGLLMALPMFMEIGLEHGFRRAFSEFIIMQLQLASVFFTFSMGTKVHFYGRTLLHGGAKYRYTGRGFVVFHAKFAENYRLYSRSHFIKGLELLILLIVYNIYGATVNKTVPYLLITSSLWFLVGTWLFAPFLFNPSGFEWQKIVDDWDDWTKWVSNRGGIGVAADKSWESWWDEERSHLDTSGFRGKLFEMILSARFLLYQYGLVYHLNITQHDKSILVYGLSWVVMLVVLVILKVVSAGRRQFKADFQIFFRLLKVGLLAATVTILSILFVVENLTTGDIFVSLLAFLPSGWAIIQIAQTCKPVCKKIGLWGSIKALARWYEYLMGLLLFAPVAALAWFPFISDFQTRLLFNQAFSRGLQISRILAGRKEKKTN